VKIGIGEARGPTASGFCTNADSIMLLAGLPTLGTAIRRDGPVQCRERLDGLLRYYHQEAA
jgi:hypothetical protein